MAIGLIAIAFIYGCNAEAPKNEVKKDYSTETIADQEIWYKTFEVDSGWGYDIYIDGSVFVHQEFIPVLQGIKPFASEENATAAAMLVVYKLKKNIVPPNVELHELDSVGALH